MYYILAAVILFLLWLTYKTKAKYFLPESVYTFWLSVKLQFYFRYQLDWIKANIGQMYVTNEVVKYIWKMQIHKSRFNVNPRLQCVVISSVLQIPKDVDIDILPVWLERTRSDAYLSDVAIRESYLSGHEAKELQELIAAIHRNPTRYKILCQYEFK